MSLPNSYLTSVKNLSGILTSIQTAQAPKKFTIKFLQSLGFKNVGDRLVIGVLKSLKFLDEGGVPQKRYYEYLDQTQSRNVLAEGIRESYQDLFEVNINAEKLSRDEVKNKLKTLGEGSFSGSVLDKMAMTFSGLVKEADFSAPSIKKKVEKKDDIEKEKEEEKINNGNGDKVRIKDLVYNIQIVLPESRDPKVYEALFRSLREHLL
ncbi:MAG: DUF5343 domain-containing protein [Nitrospinae bacterium]|nr:DUF5343 domain-containing protein [Nitrospinota bacterium]